MTFKPVPKIHFFQSVILG